MGRPMPLTPRVPVPVARRMARHRRLRARADSAPGRPVDDEAPGFDDVEEPLRKALAKPDAVTQRTLSHRIRFRERFAQRFLDVVEPGRLVIYGTPGRRVRTRS